MPQIVSLYEGAILRLYQYRVYDDVRLVACPHVQIAYYGGDTNLPQAWLDGKDEIAMAKTVNFASTNGTTSRTVALRLNKYGMDHWDVSGGNAGSVVVNSALEVVGVVVDGNVESLYNDVLFTDKLARTVSVHVDGIMETLLKIYNADRIVEELTVK